MLEFGRLGKALSFIWIMQVLLHRGGGGAGKVDGDGHRKRVPKTGQASTNPLASKINLKRYQGGANRQAR